MDKRSIIGLLIIGAILFAFSYFNAEQPTDDKNSRTEQTDSTKQVTDTLLTDVDIVDTISPIEEPVNSLVPVLNDEGFHLTNNIGKYKYKDTLTGLDTLLNDKLAEPKPVVQSTPKGPEEVVRIENDLIALDISNKGGRIINVLLKNYITYDSYLKEEEDTQLQLFDEQSTYGIEFFEGDKKFSSVDYDFKIVSHNENSAKVVMINPTGKKVIYNYELTDGKYDVDFGISFKGFTDRDAADLDFVSDFKLLSTEKHLPSEQRVSTLFFKYEEGGYDYLSIAGDDEEVLEESTQWVAYKQSYFSAILMSKTGFKPEGGSKIEVINLDEADTTYIKQFRSSLDLGITNINNTVELEWYFGPNDYDELATYENGCEDVVDLGWGLFRWINVYFMRPIFLWLLGLGVGAGISILLLTIFVKLLLSPVNYKMYKSSAMMKVLRPEIEKITKKFPKKADAMKKQQETMALYRETGVSPMAGCVPMLVQMPILFAIFRLFPSEIGLRQEGFLWAEDLSTYDSIMNLGFEIPFYGDHISLFTLLMAATTLLYTHYNSTNMQQPTMEGMPNMKYIMYFFPFMMIFFFNSYSSGLSYYYFISTLMTIGIMFAIKKFMLDEDKIHAKVEANRANPKKKKGKSKFQQRLEEAQKMQQEKQKGKKK